MKYVMFEVRQGTLTHSVPVIFPAMLVHSDVAQFMQYMIEHQYPKGEVSVVSAGFAEGVDVVATCGRSESLDIGSREGDARLVNTADHGGCVR